MSEAQKFADSVLQGAPDALAQTKRLIEELWWRSVKEDVDLALKYHMQARESHEAREGIAAFNEKRPPNWVKQGGASSSLRGNTNLGYQPCVLQSRNRGIGGRPCELLYRIYCLQNFAKSAWPSFSICAGLR